MPSHSFPGLEFFGKHFPARSVHVEGSGPEPVVSVTGLTKDAAEDLLDWLENHGCRSAEVIPDEVGFTVRLRLEGTLADGPR